MLHQQQTHEVSIAHTKTYVKRQDVRAGHRVLVAYGYDGCELLVGYIGTVTDVLPHDAPLPFDGPWDVSVLLDDPTTDIGTQPGWFVHYELSCMTLALQ